MSLELYGAAAAGDVAGILRGVVFGLDPSGPGQRGLAPFWGAMAELKEDAAIALVDVGADPNTRCAGAPALVIAAAFRMPRLVRRLLEAGADPLAMTPDGYSALDAASLAWCPECQVALLEAGARMGPKVRAFLGELVQRELGDDEA